MANPVPPEIDVINLPDGVRYRFPRRPHPVRRTAATNLLITLVMVGGAVTGAICLDMIAGALPWLRWLFLAAGLGGSLHLIILLGRFLGLWLGASEVELRSGRLGAVERIGRLRWARSWPVECLQQLHVNEGGLQVACTGRRSSYFVRGYPPDWLQALAHELLWRCKRWPDSQPPEPEVSWCGLSSRVSGEVSFAHHVLPAKPAGSRVVSKSCDGMVHLTIPPRGPDWREAVVLTGSFPVMGIATLITVLASMGRIAGAPADIWRGVAFLWIFAGVLVWPFLRAFRAQTVLIADRGSLTMERRGLVFTRRRTWPKDAIGCLRGNQPDNYCYGLQLRLRTGKYFDLLKEGSDRETQWMAAILQDALQLARPLLLDPPTGCRIRLERFADGLTLRVPRRGLWRSGAWAMIPVGILLFCSGTWLSMAAIQVAAGAWFVWIFAIAFLLFGVGLSMAAVRTSTQQVVLAAVGDHLMVLDTWFLGRRSGDWSREALADIRTGMLPSRAPLLELHILPKVGKRFAVLAGEKEDDLAWLAAVLRDTLRLPQPPGSETVDGAPPSPQPFAPRRA